MEAALKSLESSGGYAILLGIVIMAIFYLGRGWMKDQGERSHEREQAMRAEAAENLERERSNTQSYRDTTERMIRVVEGNTGAITTLVETIRPMSDTLTRIDTHLGIDARAKTAAAQKRTGGQAQ